MNTIAEFFDQVLFQLGNNKIEVKQIFFAFLSIILVIITYAFLKKVFLNKIIVRESEREHRRKPIMRRWILLFVLVALVLILRILEIDFNFINLGTGFITLRTALLFLIVLSFSSLVDWMFTYVLQQEENIGDSYRRRSKGEFSPGALIQTIILTIGAIVLLRAMNWDFKLFSITEDKVPVDFNFTRILIALLVLLIARFIVWMFTRVVLGRYYYVKKIDPSTQYAINQLLSYLIFVIASFIALENMGIQMTLLWGGAAALLVGVGLGLQQTFNDLISGIILLFERTVEVGAVVEINGTVGRVRKIGLRTSIIETRDNLAIIVPNSKLIVDIVTNWNHNDDKARFTVQVGVAYGSDTEAVKNLMIESVLSHPKVLHIPEPFVRFLSFGDSSLDMEVHFWTKELMPVENIKSDIRFAIDKAFRENGVTIPFPQRDLWIRNGINIVSGAKPEEE